MTSSSGRRSTISMHPLVGGQFAAASRVLEPRDESRRAALPRGTGRVPRVSRASRLASLVSAVALVASGSAAAAPRRVSVASVTHAPIHALRMPWGRIGYRSVGRHSPLVLIMGLAGNIDDWPPSLIAALALRHRVIVFDNEGIGLTTLRPGALTITRMADDTASVISALRLRRPDVMGWSMGGFIAQALAVRHPSAIGKLVLSATAPGTGQAVLPSGPVIGALSNGGQGALQYLFPPDRAKFAAAYTKEITSYPHFYLTPARIVTLQLQASSRWLAGRENTGRRVDRLRLPTLIGDGRDDVILPTANSVRLAHLIRGSRLKLYPDAGHGFVFQDERGWVATIERFLGA
jgi:pimeloyl-ACP methyl ester carboxylesterase